MSKAPLVGPGGETPLEELARWLREGVGTELREEAAMAEIESHVGRLRRRSLSDVAREAMHRGDRLTVAAPGRTLAGITVFVGRDYLVLETDTRLADVRLDRVILAVVRSPAGGHTTRGGSMTLRARLAEYEQTGETVTIVIADGSQEVTGTVLVAAADHLVMADADGGTVVVPTDAICLVLRPRPGTR